MPNRTTTKPDTVPAGEPVPTPVEDAPPTAPAPRPEPEEGLPPTGAFRLGPDGAEPVSPATLARFVQNLTDRTSPTAEWDAAQVDDRPLTVWEAVAAVTRQVDAIAKERTASQGGSYKYRGIDDVFAAVHPLLGEVGLLIFPGEVVESRWETRATSGGGTLNVARLRVRYTLVGPDGSTMPGEAWGEGGDSGDKATQKAHSQSYKSFVLQLFSIPTEDSARDEPDATNPASRPYTADEVERAGRAANAAQEAETLDRLVGVRHRAVALLDVPVQMDDGSLVPLSVLFDQRRVELERATSAGGAQ